VKQLFDSYKETYVDEVEKSIHFIGQDHDFFTRAKARHLLEIAAAELGDPAQLTVLDVGCGPGETDVHLVQHVRELHGVDVSAELVERAAQTNPAATYTAYDGDRLPYEDGRFDLAFAICVVHHVPPEQWAAFVTELSRVVRPGGVVAIAEHNPFNPLTRVAVNRCEFDEDAVLLSRRKATALQRRAGLTPVSSRYILFFPWEKPLLAQAEALLRRVPLGAQYIAVARRSQRYPQPA
jgi:SAM-dependent methyltransferase